MVCKFFIFLLKFLSAYHACPACFPNFNDEDSIGVGKKVGDIRKHDNEKFDKIREEMELEVIWEHESVLFYFYC